VSFIMRACSLAARQMADLLALDAADGAIAAGRLQDRQRPGAQALAHFADLRRSAVAVAGVDTLSTEQLQACPQFPALTRLANDIARTC
jgi:hypothetical protein